MIYPVGTFIDADKTASFFEGIKFDPISRMVHFPRGDVLGRNRFNIWFGGHTFARDRDGKIPTTTRAWTAFTQSSHFYPEIIR